MNLYRLATLLICLTFASGLASAQNEGIFAQIAAGADWNTQLTITNLTDTPKAFTVSFKTQSGTPMIVNPAGLAPNSQFTIAALAGNAQLVMELGGAGPLQVGYAVVDPVTGLGGSAVFRQHIAGRPDFEAFVPLQKTSDVVKEWTLPYDNTGGFVTSIAMVNFSNSFANPRFTFYNANNLLLLEQVAGLAPRNHAAFETSSLYPTTAGNKGVLRVTSDPGVNLLALRFNPGGAFTTILPGRRDGSSTSGPDLVIADVVVTEVCGSFQFVLGSNTRCRYRVTFKVRNAGILPADASLVTVVFSPAPFTHIDGQGNRTGIGPASGYVPALAAGEEASMAMSVAGVEDSECDGSPSCRVTITVDAGNDVPESNEGNNENVSTVP